MVLSNSHSETGLPPAQLLGAGTVVGVDLDQWVSVTKAAELCGAAAVINPSQEDPENRALELTNG